MPHPQMMACPHGYAERADCPDRLCRFRESNRKAARLRLERNRANGLTSHGTPPVPANKCPHGHQRKADCVTCQADYSTAPPSGTLPNRPAALRAVSLPIPRKGRNACQPGSRRNACQPGRGGRYARCAQGRR